jgi:hypothetical protein
MWEGGYIPWINLRERQAFYPDIFSEQPRKTTKNSWDLKLLKAAAYKKLFAMWWRIFWYVLPSEERRWISTMLHGVTYHKDVLFIKNLTPDSRCPERYSKRAPFEYMSRALLLEPICSV